jgi:hypothetical protein
MKKVAIYLKSGQTMVVIMSDDEFKGFCEKFKNLAMYWKVTFSDSLSGFDTSMVAGYQVLDE